MNVTRGSRRSGLLLALLLLGCGEAAEQDRGAGGAAGAGGSAGSAGGAATGGSAGTSGAGGSAGAPSYPLDDTLRVTDVAMKCTHNSYHIEPANPIDDSHRYTQAPLDVQLGEQGVRGFELDIHAGAGFPVKHIPYGLDDRSTCPDLGACLGVIDGWSATHPGHHLVVVWIEMKDELDGTQRITDYDAVDQVIRAALPARLYTPDDFLRGHATPREALDAEGWPTLGETRARVAVVLLNDGEHSRAYTRDFSSLAGRAMFARAAGDQYALPWAVVTKINDPSAASAIAAAHAAGLLIASNVGEAGAPDAVNQLQLSAGLTHGSHLLCDDFPAPVAGHGYSLVLPGGTPSVCNRVTAPSECTPAAIEALP